MYYGVLLPVPFTHEPLTYSSEHALSVGMLVQVCVRRKKMVGVIWCTDVDSNSNHTIRPVLDVLPIGFSPSFIAFIKWVARYTLTPLPRVIGASLPPVHVFDPAHLPKRRSGKEKALGGAEALKKQLNEAQMYAAGKVCELVGADTFEVCFLEGVTGSGKTEVYFEALEAVLKKGGQVLVLLPEISLTHQMLERFYKRFPHRRIETWHSFLVGARRARVWHDVACGNVDIVVGARSALFLNFKNLKGIVVDEEHDTSYKQEEGLIYQARDMAIVRAKIENILIILASATPSLETFTNVQTGKYQHVSLPQRFGTAALPESACIDMRREKTPPGQYISPTLLRAVTETLQRGKQAMLFINRRGWAPLTLCKACWCRLSCCQCSAWLVEHKKLGCYMCHYCGYKLPSRLECPVCGTVDSFESCGPGIERIEQEVRTYFPDHTIVALSSDMGGKKAYESALTQVETGQASIVLGTQIIAKGLHFPYLNCVGVVDADASLSIEDFRAFERCFQLLHQVSGRAGRESDKSLVLLQTFNPAHEVIQALLKQDVCAFLHLQTQRRQMLGFPPFGRMAGLIVSGLDDASVIDWSKHMAAHIPPWEGISVLGPVPAILARLRARFRWRFLVKATKEANLQAFLRLWLHRAGPLPHHIDVVVDVDPYSFM